MMRREICLTQPDHVDSVMRQTAATEFQAVARLISWSRNGRLDVCVAAALEPKLHLCCPPSGARALSQQPPP